MATKPVPVQITGTVLPVLVGTSTSTAGTVRYRYYRYHRYFGHKSIQKPWAMPQLWYFTLATSPRICGTNNKITVQNWILYGTAQSNLCSKHFKKYSAFELCGRNQNSDKWVLPELNSA